MKPWKYFKSRDFRTSAENFLRIMTKPAAMLSVLAVWLFLSSSMTAQTRQIRSGNGLHQDRGDSIIFSLDADRAREMIDSVCQAWRYFEIGYWSFDSTGVKVWNFIRNDSMLVDFCNPCNTVRMREYGGTVDSVFGRTQTVTKYLYQDSTTTELDNRQVPTRAVINTQVTQTPQLTKMVDVRSWMKNIHDVPIDTTVFHFDNLPSYDFCRTHSIHWPSDPYPWAIPRDTLICGTRSYDSVGTYEPWVSRWPMQNKPSVDSAYWLVPVAIGYYQYRTITVGGIQTQVKSPVLFGRGLQMVWRNWRDFNTGVVGPDGWYVYDTPGDYIIRWVQLDWASSPNHITNWLTQFGFTSGGCLSWSVDYFDYVWAANPMKDTTFTTTCGTDTISVTIAVINVDSLLYRTVSVPIMGTSHIDWSATNLARAWLKWTVPASIDAVVRDTCACVPSIETDNGTFDLCGPLRIASEGGHPPYLIGNTLFFPLQDAGVWINGTWGNTFNNLVTQNQMASYGQLLYNTVTSIISPPLPCSPCDSITAIQQKIDIATDSIYVGKERIDHIESVIECDPCTAITHHEQRLDSLEACNPCDSLDGHTTTLYNTIPSYFAAVYDRLGDRADADSVALKMNISDSSDIAYRNRPAVFTQRVVNSGASMMVGGGTTGKWATSQFQVKAPTDGATAGGFNVTVVPYNTAASHKISGHSQKNAANGFDLESINSASGIVAAGFKIRNNGSVTFMTGGGVLVAGPVDRVVIDSTGKTTVPSTWLYSDTNAAATAGYVAGQVDPVKAIATGPDSVTVNGTLTPSFSVPVVTYDSTTLDGSGYADLAIPAGCVYVSASYLVPGDSESPPTDALIVWGLGTGKRVKGTASMKIQYTYIKP